MSVVGVGGLIHSHTMRKFKMSSTSRWIKIASRMSVGKEAITIPWSVQCEKLGYNRGV